MARANICWAVIILAPLSCLVMLPDTRQWCSKHVKQLVFGLLQIMDISKPGPICEPHHMVGACHDRSRCVSR